MVDWTPEREARLKELVAEGMTYVLIGEALGCGKNAAIGAARRRGFERGADVQLTPEQIHGAKAGEARAVARKAVPPVAFPDWGHCVWPLGHPRKPGFGFCAAPVLGVGAPYCFVHAAMAYTKGAPP